MGARGLNAGGFAYMKMISCPKCGAKRKLGQHMIRLAKDRPSLLDCPNKERCEKRQQRRKGGG